MAQGSVVYKVELQVADMDRAHYADYPLRLARHPSETEERLMMRLLAFAMHARPGLEFGRGLSTDDEPDLWCRDLTGTIDLWVDVGLPDERLVRKACGRARQVVVLVYGGSKADAWWAQNRAALARFENLSVLAVSQQSAAELARLADRSMRLNCSIQEGQIWISSEHATVCVEPSTLKPAP
jgi:uncharacterized protein YaeQ